MKKLVLVFNYSQMYSIKGSVPAGCNCWGESRANDAFLPPCSSDHWAARRKSIKDPHFKEQGHSLK